MAAAKRRWSFIAQLGADNIQLMRFSESPVPSSPDMVAPGTENKVMHGCFRIGDTTLMASDGRCQGDSTFGGISLTITAPNDAEAERLFAALSEGGQVQMPMAKTFFSSRFGIVADRFGVSWMVIVER